MWTAYYLKRADPSLRITVLEARFAGFGASGRNGGWLSGLAPGHRTLLAKKHGRHGWCGVLAVPRDWTAGVELDRATGLGWAGGYVGHGVTATNLAGQTLADLGARTAALAGRARDVLRRAQALTAFGVLFEPCQSA